MFTKKQASMEHAYIHASSDNTIGKHTTVTKNNFLSTIIRILTIFILLGVLTIGGVFGYRFLQNDTPIKVLEKVQTSTAISTKSTKEPRMYTQAQMQAIMQMMMKEMKEKPVLEEEVIINAPLSQTNTNHAEAWLLTSLESIEIDHMEDITEASPIDDKENNKEITQSNNDTSIDNYNKIIVQQKSTTYDNNVDELSLKIGALVKEMEQQNSTDNSTYTQEITKEVHTRKNAMRIILVKKGDTLAKISLRAYGTTKDYKKIYHANPNLIKNPNHIYVGQRLRVPLN